jgi:hypothetical protein
MLEFSAAVFVLLNDDMKSAGIRPLLGKIYAIGSDNKDPEYQIGKWIMISHGRWTRGVNIEDEEDRRLSVEWISRYFAYV